MLRDWVMSSASVYDFKFSVMSSGKQCNALYLVRHSPSVQCPRWSPGWGRSRTLDRRFCHLNHGNMIKVNMKMKTKTKTKIKAKIKAKTKSQGSNLICCANRRSMSSCSPALAVLPFFCVRALREKSRSREPTDICSSV